MISVVDIFFSSLKLELHTDGMFSEVVVCKRGLYFITTGLWKNYPVYKFMGVLREIRLIDFEYSSWIFKMKKKTFVLCPPGFFVR